MNEKEKTNRSLLKYTKKRAAGAIAATAAMLIITGLAASGDAMNYSYLAVCLLMSVLAGLFVLLDLSYGKVVSLLFYLLLPFAALCALENYTHVIEDLTGMILILNLLFWYLLYGLLVFLTGRVALGFGLATLVPMVFGMVNYFVVQFRGTPVVPWDLLSLGTAMSVADNYTFTITWKAAFSLIAFIWIILFASKSSVKFRNRKIRTACLLIFVMLSGGYIAGIQKPEVQSFFGMDTTLFTLNVLYRNNGIAGAFLGNLRFLNIDQPDGYSVKKVETIVSEMSEAAAEESQTESRTVGKVQTAGSETDAANAESAGITEYPNIIVVMNEAFSDLSVWSEFETSEEVMPFFKSLQEEGIGGELYVSVKGGNTANTEFEFLTGDTMGFLPTGSIPYQQYINDETPSIASYLKNLGYSTLAIHPYNRSGWDRDEVYEYFGFDEFLDKNAFVNPYKMRGYISDSSAFDKIIEQYEEKSDEERLFVFEVTMQNHGGYSRETPDFTSYLELTGVESKTTSVLATEKYLTLMNQTDRALEEMIHYFEEQDEPVVVLMFGDHQPSDYITNVIKRICNIQTGETLEDLQQGYRVPFMIWSNYGLEHEYYDGISVNYLGGILMEAAGIPLTGYQQYLSRLRETLPVISGLAYRDSEGTFYNLEDDTYSELLNEYKMLQYNHLVDTKNRIDSFFGS